MLDDVFNNIDSRLLERYKIFNDINSSTPLTEEELKKTN
jgi:hypothetical protein